MPDRDEIRDLRILGEDIIEEAGQDTDGRHRSRLQELKKEKKTSFYSDLLWTLLNLHLEESEARVMWDEILKHKVGMSKELGRNVGVRVAALDYARNIKGIIRSAKIIEVKEFADTTWRAMVDSLTGLYNHRHFQNVLMGETKRIEERGGCFSILFFDIDHFKIYNDTNGHTAGDVALVEVSRLMKENIRSRDIACRYGGEEFGVVLPDIVREETISIGRRVVGALEAYDFANEEILPHGKFTISGGAATCPVDSKERGDLINIADKRMYLAKKSGGNRVE